jgi:hypothetical protein
LQAEVEAIPDLPLIEIAGVADESGRIIADSMGTLRGQPVAKTLLAPAAAIISPSAQPAVQNGENEHAVVSAHPFHIGDDVDGLGAAGI